MTTLTQAAAWLPSVSEDLKRHYGLTGISVVWTGGHYAEVESASGARILLEPRVTRRQDIPTVPRPFALDHNAATALLDSEDFYTGWVDSPDEWRDLLASDTARQLDRLVGEIFGQDGILLIEAEHPGLQPCLYPLDDADAFSVLIAVKSRRWPLGFQIAGLTVDAARLVPNAYVGSSGVVVALQRIVELANGVAHPQILNALSTLETANG